MNIAIFSAPMPYSREYIDEIVKINSIIEKSKIMSLYLTLPSTSDFFTGFEQGRNLFFEKKDFDFWKDLMSYSLKKGFDIIYCLNTTYIPFSQEEKDEQLEKLNRLLIELKKIGVNKLRVTNPFLIMYLNIKHSDFILYASTSLEYKTVLEYRNFLSFYPNIKQIVPSSDVNKNFVLLKNLRKRFPNLEIEIMVSQACIKGCPHRILHQGMEGYGIKFCTNSYMKNIAANLCNSNNIYPWEIKEYLNIGINQFKFVGRDNYPDSTAKLLNKYFIYMKAIDNIKSVENEPFDTLIHYIPNGEFLTDEIKIKDIKPFLPNINHFKKKGHLCSSYCRQECKYCFKCAEKIEKKLNLKFQ